MKICHEIDLKGSLLKVFGDKADARIQVNDGSGRQLKTTNAILSRFFSEKESDRREIVILADEVGLGKTYVALAVAISILDAIRRGETPEGFRSNKPVILVLTPTNDALFNKWMREAEAFKKDCARHDGDFEWLRIRSPIGGSSKSGNVIDLNAQVRDSIRSQPILLIAKQSVLGAALHDRDTWRRRALASLFSNFRTPTDTRRYWCRKGRVFDNFGIPELDELLDLRGSGHLWDDASSPDLQRAFSRALQVNTELANRAAKTLNGTDEGALPDILDNLTRHALVGDWPLLPLVIIDEIHGLKNKYGQSRRNFESLLKGKICRLLGLSATPFQLRHEELSSVLELRRVLALPRERLAALDQAEASLKVAMTAARASGEAFRKRWKALRLCDKKEVSDSWNALLGAAAHDRGALVAQQIRPPRVGNALSAALDLEQRNTELAHDLGPFVIRHQHIRGYREHFVGRQAALQGSRGDQSFDWSPGMEVRGNGELAQYLMMRAVALTKDEHRLPGLGAEITGSYRHLMETAAVWRRIAQIDNPLLLKYKNLLDQIIGERVGDRDPDAEHCKIQATVHRALEFFKRGQKSLIFCVYTKTAEAVRDRLQFAIDEYQSEIRERNFEGAKAFENFRKRFFNRREALFSLIQDHPLLTEGGSLDSQVALPVELLEQISRLMIAQGESADFDKPDRRLLLAATEQVAVKWWRTFPEGRAWLKEALCRSPELADCMVEPPWLEGREPLSRRERGSRPTDVSDPEARAQDLDPLADEEADVAAETDEIRSADGDALGVWVRRLREDAIGEVVAPYFQPGLIETSVTHRPLLAEYHQLLLKTFDLRTRAVAGQVFRRILMADEFLLRYLADVVKETESWADYLSKQYVRHLDGHFESLRDRVHAYLETLVRADKNEALMSGYRKAAENRNVVQLVKGDTQDRDRYFLGFNTPYRPEILVSTSVGQEGIDLHRECRHVIHHDLCWNPATIEQRTGRVDRIGSKVERERMGGQNETENATLEIAVPYLAATYDERMFEELYRRAQLFEVTLGGEMRVDGRIDPDHTMSESELKKLGIGTNDEDIGSETEESGVIDLPTTMIECLRVDLSVWKRPDI